MQVHPIIRVLSAAIILAAGALLIPSPLIPAALAEPPDECLEFDPPVCIEQCCDTYDTCAGAVVAAFNNCMDDCQGNEECEDLCATAKELNEFICQNDAEFCIFVCGI